MTIANIAGDPEVEIYTTQKQGNRLRQDDFVCCIDASFVAVADGCSECERGDQAAYTATETAGRAYRLMRVRPHAWKHKDILLRQILRSANMAVYHQKQDEKICEFYTTLSCVTWSKQKIWYAALGDTKVVLYHAHKAYDLTSEQDASKQANFMLGQSRLSPMPFMGSEPWILGDVLLLITDGIWMYYGVDKLENYLKTASIQGHTANQIGEAILKTAQANGSTANMTAVVIKNR